MTPTPTLAYAATVDGGRPIIETVSRFEKHAALEAQHLLGPTRVFRVVKVWVVEVVDAE
jgi:hypothetical protein